YEDTPEYQEFKSVFGMTLDQLKEPGKLKDAVKFVQANIAKKLKIQYEMVAEKVNFTTERLTSNGMALIDQLKSRRGMSGTPWNVSGYDRKLATNYLPDKGTEGIILEMLQQKVDDIKHLHTSDFSSVTAFMDTVYKKHQHKDKIRGIIEAGGLFKTLGSNADVAQALMSYLKTENPAIEGILFFHTDPGQKQPDTLYVWRKDAKYPERIGGSSVENLSSKGLDPKKYFVYYDERHTTGTDILQMPDAINLFTYDVQMIRRTMAQGIMRLRQFLFSQNVELVISETAKQSIYNEGKTLRDLIYHAEKVQSIRKSHDMVRYFRQQIDNVFRRIAMERILANPTDVEVYRTFENYVVTKLKDDPYHQFGSLLAKGDTKAFLKAYLQHRYDRFPDKTGLDQAMTELKDHIDKATCLPEEWDEMAENLGVEQEVAVQVQQQVDQQLEQDREIEKEIELELQWYEACPYSRIERDMGLTREQFLGVVDRLKHAQPESVDVIPLSEQLKKFPYFKIDEATFDQLFTTPIFGTRRFFYSTDQTLPVFHKAQRPPNQILMVRTDRGFRFLCLSEHEARDVREHMQKEPRDDAWLIMPDYRSYLETSAPMPEYDEEQTIQNALLEINAFGGNITYLDQHIEETEMWIKNHSQVKIRFLKLRSARDKTQYQVLWRCPAIVKSDHELKHNPNCHVFEARMELEKNKRGNTHPASEDAIKDLNPRQLRDLNVKWVPHLKENQKEHLQPYQVPFLTFEQVKWLPVEMVKYLDKPEQIFHNNTFALSEDQVKRLEENQKHLIPFVNPDFYKHFTERWQVEAVDPSHIGKLSPAGWAYISPSQIKKLQPKSEQDVLELNNPEKYASLHGDYVLLIPEKDRDMITEEQIREITNSTLIQQFPWEYEMKWTGWIRPNMVAYIAENQVPYLKTPEQIANVIDQRVPRLDPKTQVPLIQEGQVPHLKGKEQFQAVVTKLVRHIPLNKVKHCSVAQLPHLRNGQIKCILTQEQFTNLTPQQMESIDDNQFQFIEEKHVRGLSKKQLLALQKARPGDWEKLRKGLVAEQITDFNSQEEYDLLGAEQLQSCLKEQWQVAFLKQEFQIQACPAALVCYLKKAQLQLISTKQFSSVTVKQLRRLIGHKKWDKFREKISEAQVNEFTKKKQVDILKPEQI
ncbi:MAG: hypothetical protein KDK65_04935, partial [Chlamydiia bacterium]|nr:hypothetical protein [Chlamydiia bacterium]